MELAPAGVPLSFEVTFDRDDLFVGMSVYDDSGSDPVLVDGPTLMDRVASNTYRGKFTADANTNYIVIKAVYTDEELTTLNTDYSQGSESIVTKDFSAGASSGCCVVGIVDNTNPVVGLVNC